MNTPTRLVSLSGAIRRDLEISTNAVQFLTPYATDPPLLFIRSWQIRKSMADEGADVFVCGLLDEVPHSSDDTFPQRRISLHAQRSHFSALFAEAGHELAYTVGNGFAEVLERCWAMCCVSGSDVRKRRSTPFDLGCSIAGCVHPQPPRKRRRALAGRDSVSPRHGGWGKGFHRPRQGVYRSGGGDEGKEHGRGIARSSDASLHVVS